MIIINSWPTANFCPAKEVNIWSFFPPLFSFLLPSPKPDRNHQSAMAKTHLRISHLFCLPGNFSTCAWQCCPLDWVTQGAAWVLVSSCCAGLGSHCLKSHGVFSVTLQAANHSWGKYLLCVGMITQIWTTSPSPLCSVMETLLLLPSSAVLARAVHRNLGLVLCPPRGPKMLWFHRPWRWCFSASQVEKFYVLSRNIFAGGFTTSLSTSHSLLSLPSCHTPVITVGPLLTHSLSQDSSAPYGVPTPSSNLAPTHPTSAVPDAQTLLVLPSTWSCGVRSTFQCTFTSHRLSAQSFNTSGTSNFTKFLQPHAFHFQFHSFPLNRASGSSSPCVS